MSDTSSPSTRPTSLNAIYPSLAGRRVLVTGGGSGIGEALVEAFVVQRAQVAFIDIAEESSLALVERLSGGDGPAPIFEPCDLTDIDALKQAIAGIERRLGGHIDVLVNNAANDDRHAIGDVTPDYWDNRMAVNLRHLFFAAQAVAPGMKQGGRRRDPQLRIDQLASRAARYRALSDRQGWHRGHDACARARSRSDSIFA